MDKISAEQVDTRLRAERAEWSLVGDAMTRTLTCRGQWSKNVLSQSIWELNSSGDETFRPSLKQTSPLFNSNMGGILLRGNWIIRGSIVPEENYLSLLLMKNL